jgi:ABC-type nitrate/sulfonate/bicarbonate transport system substrate-binding protein
VMKRPASMMACAAVALAATALVACGGGDDDGPAAAGREAGDGTAELTLATPAPDSLFTFNDLVARELGFYEDERVEVKLAAVSDEIPVAGLVQNGNADVGLVAATDAISAAIRTSDLKLPYDERTGGNGFIVGVVVPEDSDVDSIAALKGKNVGLASPDQDRAFLASALDKAGLSLDDVQTTVVGPGGASVAQTLESGRIAAYTGTLNDFFAFNEAGLPVRDITPEGLEGLPVGGYIVRGEDLEKSDALIRFFRALAEGTYVGIERPKVAEAVARKVAPEEWREPELARQLLAGLSDTLVPFDGKHFGEVLPERWENAQQLLLDTGVTQGQIDLSQFLVTDVLDEINDFDRKAALARADEWLAANGGK